MMSAVVFNMSSGTQVTIQIPYTPQDVTGVLILSVAAGLSFTAVLVLLVIITLSAVRSLRSPDQIVFVRTHVAAYFVSLLFSDLTQSLGSLMSIEWIIEKGVRLSIPCTAQAAIKNGGNVGTAFWSMVIAIHTFCVIFLECRPRDAVLYSTLILGWTIIGVVVVIGPAAIETPARGPYFGVSGLWCWITGAYQPERLLLEYLWMFSSAFVSFVLYVLVFLKLRGNIVVSGWRIRFRRRVASTSWEMQTGKTMVDSQLMSIAKQMLWYPVAYTVLILPIAACRYADWAGHTVPFQVTIFSDTVFLLSGLVNAVLFCSTRRLMPNSTLRFSDPRNTTDIEGKISSQQSYQTRHTRTLSSISNESFEASKAPLSPRRTKQVDAASFVAPPRPAPTIPVSKLGWTSNRRGSTASDDSTAPLTASTHDVGSVPSWQRDDVRISHGPPRR